jgi:hypothetical protein
MKATTFLFVTIGCTAVMHGTSYAAQSNQLSSQTSSKTAEKTATDHPRDPEHATPATAGKHKTDQRSSDEPQDHRNTSEKNLPRKHPNLTTTNHPKQPPSSQNRSKPANALNLNHPRSDKLDGAAKGGAIHPETVNNGFPVRSRRVARSTTASPNNTRHRGPNPAVIGGSASSGRNTGAINGTRVNRKP